MPPARSRSAPTRMWSETGSAPNPRDPPGPMAQGLLHLPEAPPSGEACDDTAKAKEEQECGDDEADDFYRDSAHRLAVHRPGRRRPGRTSEQVADRQVVRVLAGPIQRPCQSDSPCCRKITDAIVMIGWAPTPPPARARAGCKSDKAMSMLSWMAVSSMVGRPCPPTFPRSSLAGSKTCSACSTWLRPQSSRDSSARWSRGYSARTRGFARTSITSGVWSPISQATVRRRVHVLRSLAAYVTAANDQVLRRSREGRPRSSHVHLPVGPLGSTVSGRHCPRMSRSASVPANKPPGTSSVTLRPTFWTA
jgi:hypothetical protein